MPYRDFMVTWTRVLRHVTDPFDRIHVLNLISHLYAVHFARQQESLRRALENWCS